MALQWNRPGQPFRPVHAVIVRAFEVSPTDPPGPPPVATYRPEDLREGIVLATFSSAARQVSPQAWCRKHGPDGGHGPPHTCRPRGCPLEDETRTLARPLHRARGPAAESEEPKRAGNSWEELCEGYGRVSCVSEGMRPSPPAGGDFVAEQAGAMSRLGAAGPFCLASNKFGSAGSGGPPASSAVSSEYRRPWTLCRAASQKSALVYKDTFVFRSLGFAPNMIGKVFFCLPLIVGWLFIGYLGFVATNFTAHPEVIVEKIFATMDMVLAYMGWGIQRDSTALVLRAL